MKIYNSNITKIIVALVVIMAVNWLGSFVLWQVDLTADKRYTLSDVTTEFLSDDISKAIHVDLYLDGSINSGFSRLEQASLTMLNQFRALNKQHVSFNQIIIDDVNGKQKKNILKNLSELGVTPMNVIDEDHNGKRVEKAVFPWAVVTYGDKQLPVRLLVNVDSKSGQENLNSSIENLEYSFTEAFRLLSDTVDRRIAFLEGHGELDEGKTYDITSGLSYHYNVDRGRISTDASVLDAYEAVIVAKPSIPFSESEKYVLDQYIMKGGKVLWLVDGVKMSMDSLTRAATNYGIYNDVNLSDMLFRYGVRINPNLVQDKQCALFPVNIAGEGEQARFQPLPWYYAPLLQPNPKHPITRYNSNVKAEFVSTIDTVGNLKNVKKTILLTTSAHTKVEEVPMAIDLGMSVKNIAIEEFTAGQLPVAILLEGEFTSPYTNRLTPRDLQNTSKTVGKSQQTKMIVIADGELMKNDLRGYGEEMQVVPLGYDHASNQVLFGNKDFLLNAINYLVDDDGWYELRQRTVKLRLLDKKQMARRQYYRWLNIGLPLFCLLLLGLLVYVIQKRRYAK